MSKPKLLLLWLTFTSQTPRFSQILPLVLYLTYAPKSKNYWLLSHGRAKVDTQSDTSFLS